jgi:hypothetical protein
MEKAAVNLLSECISKASDGEGDMYLAGMKEFDALYKRNNSGGNRKSIDFSSTDVSTITVNDVSPEYLQHMIQRLDLLTSALTIALTDELFKAMMQSLHGQNGVRDLLNCLKMLISIAQHRQ